MSVLYIDESKTKGYTIVAATVLPADARAVRKALSDLRMPGQRRIHFVTEGDSRRRKILSALCDMGLESRVYHARGMDEPDAREACLAHVIEDAATFGVTRIVIEQDDSVVEFDRRVLYRELNARGLRDRVSYTHEKPAVEPLLWIPDAVAWSFARGGEWTNRVSPLITQVVRVD